VIAEQREAMAASTVDLIDPIEGDVVLDPFPGVVKRVGELALQDVESIMGDPCVIETRCVRGDVGDYRWPRKE